MKKNLFGGFFISLIALCCISCSKENYNHPDATTLNMLNEQNGKTLLGASEVFINNANNFQAGSSFINEAGKSGGVGANVPPKLDNLTKQVAVTPGHLYQIFDRSALYDFPSGKRATQIGAAYIQAYVVSSITEDNKTTGAVVKHVLMYPPTNGLPTYEHNIGRFLNGGEILEIKLPKGAECVFGDRYDNTEDLEMWIEGEKLYVKLLKSPNNTSGPWGNYGIYIRVGNSYTRVVASVGVW